MKFRKKPVVVEAVQWNKPGDHDAVVKCYFDSNDHLRWAPGYPPEINIYCCYEYYGIRTLDGWHKVYVGDWIIKGVKGEFYLCKPDIFEMTYEAVTELETNTAKP